MITNYTRAYSVVNTQMHNAIADSSAMGISKTLEALMDARGLNPHSLAKASGVPQPTIWRIINNPNHEPRKGTVDKLAAALNVSPAEVYGDEESTTPKPSVFAITEDERDLLAAYRLAGQDVRSAIMAMARTVIPSTQNFKRRSGDL